MDPTKKSGEVDYVYLRVVLRPVPIPIPTPYPLTSIQGLSRVRPGLIRMKSFSPDHPHSLLLSAGRGQN